MRVNVEAVRAQCGAMIAQGVLPFEARVAVGWPVLRRVELAGSRDAPPLPPAWPQDKTPPKPDGGALGVWNASGTAFHNGSIVNRALIVETIIGEDRA